MFKSDSICFGLIAGGKSSRMGTDKASLSWRGQPLWQHQLRLGVEIGAGEILISGKPAGPYRDAARVIPDAATDIGPLAGLAALFNTMKSDWLVVVAVDMPFLKGETLRELLAARDDCSGVVPCIGELAEPLAAVYPRSVQPLISRRLQLADHALQGFVREAAAAGLVRLRPWSAASSNCFRSLNTSTEYADALAIKSVG